MDDGGGYVEAQPGPNNNNEDTREPWTWMEATMLCLSAASSVGMVAGGLLILHGWTTRPDADPLVGWIYIVVGFIAIAVAVFLMVTEFRNGREVEAMTRRHMLPVSPR
ncbi:unnamed protein product [Alopecurus aequalis]